MTALLRSFIVYCMLLALPCQGYAAAAMMTCLPAKAAVPVPVSVPAVAHMAMPAGPHDHAAMMAALAHDNSQDSSSSAPAGPTHGSAKCGGSACCIACAPMLTPLPAVPALPAASGAVAVYAGYLPVVDLAHPERPPQA